MVTKVRGSFNDFEGALHLDAEDPSQSSGRVVVDAASVATGNADRDAHLRTGDFFAADEHPQIVFESARVEPAGDDRYRVTGDLTIKGVTKSVTIDFEYTGTAVDPFENERVGLEGSVVINRKDWGVSFNAVLEAGGVMVSDKITLELDVSAIKNKD
jgi:polyisoprenoid-binding protein YceI